MGRTAFQGGNVSDWASCLWWMAIGRELIAIEVRHDRVWAIDGSREASSSNGVAELMQEQEQHC
eukprot:COSAG02_NODE_16040_length_1118_cov_1.644750_1_plen_63_part_10